MKPSITSRLTLTSAALTALVLAPAGLALYIGVAAEIRGESERHAEALSRSLVHAAVQRWDEDLLFEFEDGPRPLESLAVDAPHWALVRGDGLVLRRHGAFDGLPDRVDPSGSSIVESAGAQLRIAAAPLLTGGRESLDTLPAEIRAVVAEKSPQGVFLRATGEFLRYKKDPTQGEAAFEVTLLESGRRVELAILQNGRFVRGTAEPLDAELPRDLAALLEEETGATGLSIVSWAAYPGQLLARVSGHLACGETFEVTINRLGERFLADEDGAIAGPDPSYRLWVATLADAASEIAAYRELGWGVAVGLSVVWGAVVLIGWYVTRRALSPVKRIVETVAGIGVARLGERLPVGEALDELSTISSTINGMLDRIEDGYRRERRFTGDASHELRGPLAKVIADIDVALVRERDGLEYRDALERCRGYAMGMQRLVESLLWLARLDSKHIEVRNRTFELTDLIADIVRLLPAKDAARVRLELVESASTLDVRGDPDLVRVLLQNLIQNALRYSADDRPVELRLDVDGARVAVEVRDHGDGVPDDQLERLFERFYRVDRSRSRETGGFGLGLAIVHEIAEVHGTRVTLRNSPAGGLTAAFSLPLCSPVDEIP